MGILQVVSLFFVFFYHTLFQLDDIITLAIYEISHNIDLLLLILENK